MTVLPASLTARTAEDRRRLLLILACRPAEVPPDAGARLMEKLASRGAEGQALLADLARRVAGPLPETVEGLALLAADVDRLLAGLVPRPAEITVDNLPAVRPDGHTQPSHVRVLSIPSAGSGASS